MEIAQQDKNVIYLTADSGEGGLDLMFRRNFPDRAFDFGIAEENMVAAAAGLATAGKRPFIYTAAPFLAYRTFEFIRNDICLQNVNVKLIGTGSGLSVSTLGPTHHTTEDIGILRTLPGLTIFSPATPIQAYACMFAAWRVEGPVYIRLGLNREREFLKEGYTLKKLDIIREGEKIIIITTGSILEEVVQAAEMLEQNVGSVKVINVPVIKRINIKPIVEDMKKAKLVCVVEEHNVLGGLGTIIVDEINKANCVIPIFKIGLEDSFSVGYGELKQVRKENGLDAESIYKKVAVKYNE